MTPADCGGDGDTVATDLAVAVLCGIVIAALSFAWRHAREIRAT
jgi:SulP family sulfate permease